jgi:hypothetical protein
MEYGLGWLGRGGAAGTVYIFFFKNCSRAYTKSHTKEPIDTNIQLDVNGEVIATPSPASYCGVGYPEPGEDPGCECPFV